MVRVRVRASVRVSARNVGLVVREVRVMVRISIRSSGEGQRYKFRVSGS